MWRHLNNDVSWREIDSSISNSRKNDRIYCVCTLEPTENAHLLIMRNISMNERPFKEFSKLFNEKPIIWKDDYFVTPLFMILHQILTGHELIWVTNVHFRLFIVLSFSEIRLEILVCHIALNFNALDSCQKSFWLQVHPICLIELWPDQKVQVSNSIVFSH